MRQLKCYLKKYWVLFTMALLVIFLSIIPLRLAIASYQAPFPQGILTLGGGLDREQFTAQFAQHFPNLNIWVSSGTSPNIAFPLFQNLGIPKHRLYLDYHAVDTVTNFTSLVSEFQCYRIHHLYLITSNFHMPRAKAIAIIVLGSQGITFTPVSVPSDRPNESLLHILRDCGRSLLWVFTGRTGASFNSRISHLSYASK